jgi:1-acyl-sn-glycerol-3-phosphate acyltransferase
MNSRSIEISSSLPTEVAERPVPESHFMATLSFEVLRLLTLLDIDPKSREQLQQLNEQLCGSSAVMYAYHPGKIDAVIMPIVLRRLLPNLNVILGPVAISHYQGIERRILDWASTQTGTLPLPIVRDRDLQQLRVLQEDPEETVSAEMLKSRLSKLLFRTCQEYLTKPGNLLGIAPGGTRSRQLTQEELNPGFLSIARRAEVQLVSAALFYEKGRLKLRVGPLLPPPEKSENLAEPETLLPYIAQLQNLLPADRR